MKRTFVKTTGVKFMSAIIIAASLLALVPATGKANGNSKTIEIISAENKTSVQFTGSSDNALFFDVKVNNPNADKFTLIIQSADGEVLYSKEYNDTSFSKKVKLLKGDSNMNYHFIIKSNNKDLVNDFVISTTIKTVDDVTVTKL